MFDQVLLRCQSTNLICCCTVGPDMDAGCTVSRPATEAAEALTLEAAFGEKEAAWLKGQFMTNFGALLQPVGVFVAEDLLLLTPDQAQTICWSDSKRPFTVAKKKLQRLLQQVSQEQRVMAVLQRYEVEIGKLLSTDEGRCRCSALHAV